jgi:hypothetical protein
MSAKTSYERYSKTKLPFLTYGEDGTMNGHWDVTETKEFLEGIRTGQEEVLKRLFSIPSNTQGYTCFETNLMCIRKVTRCSFIIKLMKVMKEGIYIGAEYYNPMFCFG